VDCVRRRFSGSGQVSSEPRHAANGVVYLTGRAKDLIIRGGHNIDPRVIDVSP
jgi:acyl-CoA synthetase (AMP-forming)/AMP-acid ligase II